VLAGELSAFYRELGTGAHDARERIGLPRAAISVLDGFVLAFNAAISISGGPAVRSPSACRRSRPDMQKYTATGPGSGGWGARRNALDQRTRITDGWADCAPRLYCWSERRFSCRACCDCAPWMRASDVNLLTLQIPLAPRDTPQLEEGWPFMRAHQSGRAIPACVAPPVSLTLPGPKWQTPMAWRTAGSAPRDRPLAHFRAFRRLLRNACIPLRRGPLVRAGQHGRRAAVG